MLKDGGMDARYLGLVPAEHFDDRRAAAPLELLLGDEEAASAGLEEQEAYDGPVSSIWACEIEVPRYTFTPATINQRYHVELWCEKSTMNGILSDLAYRYRLNVITGVGELSTTHCHKLVQRALASERPVRILYISDFDPAGLSMPVAAARKIEFFIHHNAPELDVQLRPVALTHEQCLRFRLPRTPIKESERRAERFELRYGEGATELDALEALRPGELRRILVEEIERYYDHDLADAVEAAADDFTNQQDAVREAVLEEYQDEMDAIADEQAELVRQCNEALAPFREALDRNTERAAALQRSIIRRLRDDALDPAEIEWPEPAEGDEDADPLFDSTRDYVAQIECYRLFQGKESVEAQP
jgi:hypothetical protein